MRNAFLCAAVAACSFASPAAAAEVVGSYQFSGSDFSKLYGTNSTIPTDPFTGSFSYTYDTTTNAFTLTGFTGDVGGQHFTSALSSVTTGALSIYGAPYGAAVFGSDFVLNMTFDNSTGQVGTLYQLQYGTADANAYQALDASVAAVPEPASWGLMLLGFAGVGFVMRRHRKQSARLLQIA